MNLEGRMAKLEAIVALHLEESGSIRTDLAWLKRSFWALTTGVITLNIGIAVFLVQRIFK